MSNEKSCCAFCRNCDVLRAECQICGSKVNVWDDCCAEFEAMVRHGFTLVELLIVVAIIGALVAIALPTLGNKLENAREVADVANLRAAYSEALANHYLEDSAGDTETISGVKLSSTGALEYVDVDGLPFTLPEKFSFSPGTYSATFDFSTTTPTVALKASTD